MRVTVGITAAVLSAAVLAPVTASAHAAAHAAEAVPLAVAAAGLPVTDENRQGYDRSLFPHWTDTDRDGCNTRAEVLIEEAVVMPEVGERCRLSGGQWESYYDGRAHTEARALDIDHMVPLAEAWDSGASEWTTDRRRDYANDMGEPVALVAVTAAQNRSKADKDPAQWLPASAEAHCRYATEWTTVKVRWALTVDPAEHEALVALAAECPDAVVETEAA
ncbi:HNH endonuclease family protein [Nocardiopsis sp. RV163]|uniref:HNH endonuclease family protein n=1 Tax=Nocardiopsis sp. RV163 TaxID=1661388 RepID=UPI000B043969|nr:HNH endonuclease family protein [Nocardiopsis sp. RV163]